jgi:hypothetical protein
MDIRNSQQKRREEKEKAGVPDATKEDPDEKAVEQGKKEHERPAKGRHAVQSDSPPWVHQDDERHPRPV